MISSITSAELLITVFQHIPLPVLLVDPQGRVTLTNMAARQLLSLQNEQLLTENEHGRKIEAAIRQFRHNPHQRIIEVSWYDKRIFRTSLYELDTGSLIIALHDITDLKELDEIKSIFVETVSHDLKNPLSTIHGYATLLGMEQLSDRGQANLEGLLQGVEQIQSLIQNLLDLSRIESGADGQIELCDLAEIIEEVVANFGLPVQEKGINLVADVPEALAVVSGNPLRLSQVVSNLLSNAVKYTPKGGRVYIGVSHQGDQIRLRVADSGPGIAPEEQAKIFQKFYRVPTMEDGEWIEGTGLGLSIVKAIIEGYGGSIVLASEPGVGSTFDCWLPAVEEPEF
jgi:signal transduction histidine kinase